MNNNNSATTTLSREESRKLLRDFAGKYDMRRACDKHPQGCPPKECEER